MSIDKLRAHYGLTRMPFSKDLAPGMLHADRAHGEAVARISWCVAEQQVGVITGECGAGKTVAARAAVSALDASRHTVLYLGTPGIGLRGIYATIVTGLGARPRFHRAALIPQAQELLAAETAERGKRVVLVCDEAHLLDADCPEGLRCLSNMEMDQAAPFCLLLLGQPTLRRRLRPGAFAAPDQRVGVRYAISGLDGAETASYIAHHLKLAGRADTLFQRSRDRADRPGLPWPAAPGQQPRRRRVDRVLRRGQVDRRGVRRPPGRHRGQRRMSDPAPSLFDPTPARPALPAPADWPAQPATAAHNGLQGEIVAALAPHTEADPVAILGQLLVAFGAAAGRGAYFQIEATRHRPNEFLVLVGDSAKARKGSS